MKLDGDARDGVLSLAEAELETPSKTPAVACTGMVFSPLCAYFSSFLGVLTAVIMTISDPDHLVSVTLARKKKRGNIHEHTAGTTGHFIVRSRPPEEMISMATDMMLVKSNELSINADSVLEMTMCFSSWTYGSAELTIWQELPLPLEAPFVGLFKEKAVGSTRAAVRMLT